MARALIPNSTQIPDVIIDHWMAALSGAEFKVLLYVARRTYGFGKDADEISLNQLARGIRRRDGTRLDRGTGLSRSGVKSACNALIAKGLLIRVTNTAEGGLEPEESTYRLNLFAALPDDDGQGVGQKSAQVGRGEAYPQVGQELTHLGRKEAGGRPESGRGVGRKLAPQETVPQETVQETASAGAGTGPPGESGGAADADLVNVLVGHGVGRSVAVKLAAEKPDACRRCLEYLPYARVRTTPGAWLASAIRDEFGPPEGYVRASRERAARADGPPRTRPDDRGEGRPAHRQQLGEGLARLEREQPEAFAAFSAFLAAERARAGRFAGRLTDRGRYEYLTGFDSGAYRLEVFERWLGGEGRRFRGIVGTPGARGESTSTGPPASHPVPVEPDSSASDQLGCGGRRDTRPVRRDGRGDGDASPREFQDDALTQRAGRYGTSRPHGEEGYGHQETTGNRRERAETAPRELRAEEGRLDGGGTGSGPDPGCPVRGADRTDGRTPASEENDVSMLTDIPGVARWADGPGGSGHDRREPAWSWEGDGSRYRLEGHRPSLVIIVGWDRPLATYFLQVWDVPAGAADHEEGELLLWGGTSWGELLELEDLEHALSPFAALPHGLAARLMAEQLVSRAGGPR